MLFFISEQRDTYKCHDIDCVWYSPCNDFFKNAQCVLQSNTVYMWRDEDRNDYPGCDCDCCEGRKL